MFFADRRLDCQPDVLQMHDDIVDHVTKCQPT